MQTLPTSLALILLAGTTLAQTTTVTTTTTTTQPLVIRDDVVILTPQARRPVWHRAANPARLDAVNLDVSINQQVATTLIELTLFNPSSTPQQAELLLPVPDGATVRSLQYDGTGPEPTAKVLPRDEARRIYDSIVSSMKDPALLEFARFGVLRTSAFPIPPNTAQKVRITLEQVLTADSGRLDWVLPRTEALAGTGVPWTLKATVNSNEPIASVFSPSHEVKIERTAPGSFTISGDANAFKAAGSLRLCAMKAAPGNEPVFTSAAYPDGSAGGKGGYFNLIVSLPPANDRPTVKREVTLVIDRSGSMRGDKFKQAIDAARNVVAGLADGELFNIIDYSDQTAALSPTPLAKDADTSKRANAYLDALTANGGTNIRDALIEAVRTTPQPGTLPLVLFMTDGIPTVGERNEGAIKAAVKDANSAARRLFTFGVGFDVNSPLLSALARSTRGSTTFVTPDENVEVKVSQMFKRLSGPVLASPRLTVIDTASGAATTTLVRDMIPSAADAPDVFDGEQVVICGRYTDNAPFKVRIDGSYLGKPHTFEYQIDPAKGTTSNAWVSRFWASRRVGSLLETIRSDYADKQIDPKNDPRAKELIDEVVALSTRFGILTEYTAFLATEPTVALGDDHVVRERLSTGLNRANNERWGLDAVKQEGKLAELAAKPAGRDGGAQIAGGGGNNVQYYYESRGGQMVKQQINNVNQVQDRTFFARNNRWVEGANITSENEKPDRTVTVGTPEYAALADELLAANLGALLALEGDVYMNWQGQRVLIRNTPEPAQPAPAPAPNK